MVVKQLVKGSYHILRLGGLEGGLIGEDTEFSFVNAVLRYQLDIQVNFKKVVAHEKLEF